MAVSKYEIKAQRELEADGWIVDYKRGLSRFAKMRDFFNLFDLVAIKKGFPIRYIAIKGKAGDYHKLRPLIAEFWMPECCQKELWRYTSSKKYKGKPLKEIISDNNSTDSTHSSQEAQ